MSPTITRIATIQHQLRELGRIRLGQQVAIAGKPGKSRPEKLATFRLTSASREYIEAAAAVYQGEVKAWTSPKGAEFEVVIKSPYLDVLVPPGNAVSQAFEMWSGGGCIRRCDGITQENLTPCACPEDPAERAELAGKGEACKPTTRLWVILPRLPDLGRWRLESHGYYAAVELAGMAEVASMATSRGIMLQARLRLDHRNRKVPGQRTKDYYVPVLELPDTNFAALVTGGFIPTTAPQLADPERPALGSGIAPTALAAGVPERVERPALGPAPAIPAGDDFGRPTPVAGPPVAPPTVAGWPVDSAPSAAAQAAAATEPGDADADSGAPDPDPQRGSAAGTSLVETMRGLADRSPLLGERTGPQVRRLRELFADVPDEVVQAGVRVVFGDADGRITGAAEAQAVIDVADSLATPEGDGPFRAQWAALAAAS